MTLRTWTCLFSVVVLVANIACQRSDLYAITSEVGPDAGDGGAGAQNARGSEAGTTLGGANTQPNGGSRASGSGGSGQGGSSGDSTGKSVAGSPSSCPSLPLPVGDTSVSLQVGGQSRSYVLHIPSTYDGKTPVPLVLDFHGIGSSGWGELSSSPYPAVTDREGVLMAFPDGLKGPAGTGWNMGPCCVADADDVAFAKAVVADVERTACIDRGRVYAVGVLTGGGMVHYLACQAADTFAAVAPAAFDLLKENVDECNPTRPISVISFRGTAVSRVPYAGGSSSLVPGMPITFLGAQETFEQWAKLDGCTGSPSPEDGNGCSSYSGCGDNSEVVLCTKQGGTEEPGDPNIAWPVLKRHSL
jgi:polyhydroxybutyrate depolymerase